MTILNDISIIAVVIQMKIRNSESVQCIQCGAILTCLSHTRRLPFDDAC